MPAIPFLSKNFNSDWVYLGFSLFSVFSYILFYFFLFLCFLFSTMAVQPNFRYRH